MIALYNPRYFEVAGKRTINEADIRGFVWSHARWGLKVNEMKKFPDEVGEALMRVFPFLILVDRKNLAEIEKIQKEEVYKCDECDFSSTAKIGLIAHKRTHEKGEEGDTGVGAIQSAEPEGNYKAPTVARKMSPEQQEGIPQGGTKYNPTADKDGVGWYGAGREDDTV
jgi:hypothetical protein